MLPISNVILPVFFTFLIGIAAAFFVLHFFPKWNLLDNPKAYGYKRQPIPLPGGIAPVFAFLLSLLLFFPLAEKILALFCAIILISVVSFIDDRKNISPFLRLCIHFFSAALLVAAGIRIDYLSNPFSNEALFLPDIFFLLPAIITTLWLVGFANVLNWLDGVPGLSAASAAAAGVFLGVLSLSPLVNQPEIAMLSFVFAAAALSFVFFNISPPKMLLGDTGAMTFGFVIAALSVFSGGKMATVFLVLALPLLDAFFVIIRRILAGKNPFRGRDNRHLHDRLSRCGVSERGVLAVFLIPSLILGWGSLQLQTGGKLLLIVCSTFVFLSFSAFLEKCIRRKTKKR